MTVRRPLVQISGAVQELPTGDTLPSVAPASAQYVTLATDATLSDERVLTGTTNQVSVTDGGAGGNVVLSTPQDIHTAAVPEFAGTLYPGIDPGASPPTGGDLRFENGLIVPTDTNSRPELYMVHAPHRPVQVQPSFGARCISMARGINGTSSLAAYGALLTSAGASTARSVANTNTLTSMRRLGHVTGATAGSSAGTRFTTLQLSSMGGSGFAYAGGFLVRLRFGIAQVAVGMRWFVGLYGTAATIGNVNPSSLLNMVGFGIDAGQTTVREMRRGAGAGIYNDLGADFPATTANVVYEATISCPPGGTQFSVALYRLDDNNLFAYKNQMTISLPASSVIYAPQIWVNNGAAASAVGIDNAGMYAETDL